MLALLVGSGRRASRGGRAPRGARRDGPARPRDGARLVRRPAFPVSARRLEKVFGGARGVALAPALARVADPVLETLPDLVLRQIAWERDHPAGAPAVDLADYRAAWLGLRAPVYRPKGVGRARPDGTLAAWRLLAEVLDLGGWAPAANPDDWGAIADAARIDALCCAYAGLRLAAPEAHAIIGAAGRGRAVVPADANLRGRIDLTAGAAARGGRHPDLTARE